MSAKKRIKRVTLYKAIEGHYLWCISQDFSKNTLNDYTNTFRFFTEFIDPHTILDDIVPNDIEAFMRHMAETPISDMKGVTGQYADGTEKQRRRSRKTLSNYLTGLKSLWKWAVKEGYSSKMVAHEVEPPRVAEPPIQPLTSAEIKRLMRACEESREWKDKPGVRNYRYTEPRDKALIALMVETGLRVSEVARLNLEDVDFTTGTIQVIEGKGRKSRDVPFERTCARYLRAWLMIRDGDEDLDAPFFVNIGNNPGRRMSRQVIGRLIRRIGGRAGVKSYPQRLRVTAACMMAANGMTVFPLKRILGHSQIKTTMRYVEAAAIDTSQAMRRYSPMSHI